MTDEPNEVSEAKSTSGGNKWLILVGLLLLGGALFVATRFFPKKPAPEFGLSETEQETVETEEGFTGKLKDALSLGKSMRCTWQQSEQNYGVTHIKDNKIYVEMNAEGKKTHLVVVDGCNYSWEEGQAQGVKFCVEPEEAEEEIEAPEAFSWEVPGMNYSCEPTVISDSMFTPPADVQFVDPFEAMKEMDLPEGFELPTN